MDLPVLDIIYPKQNINSINATKKNSTTTFRNIRVRPTTSHRKKPWDSHAGWWCFREFSLSELAFGNFFDSKHCSSKDLTFCVPQLGKCDTRTCFDTSFPQANGVEVFSLLNEFHMLLYLICKYMLILKYMFLSSKKTEQT